MEPLLSIEHVSKYYGENANVTKALDDVCFTVESGEFVGIMGASGSGKTTMLQCISTLDEPTGGRILLDKKDITKLSEREIAHFRSENLGFVFQEYNLLDTLTLGENIELALTIRRAPKEEIRKKVKAVAGRLGILDQLNKFPLEVSGGQKQRCACARALINHPKIVFADEPTGALDSKSARMLLETFTHMNEQMNATILMVTHDAFSASYCKRILFLKDGKIFHELQKGSRSRKEFLDEILDVLSLTGGDGDAE